MARTFSIDAATARMFTQRSKRGISRGDVVELPNGQLGKVTGGVARTRRITGTVLTATRAGVDKAASAYGEFKGRKARTASLVKMPKLKGEAWKLGELVGVVYLATHNSTGKPRKYLHEFRTNARPALAVCNDGQQLVILGGGYWVTDRGIIG